MPSSFSLSHAGTLCVLLYPYLSVDTCYITFNKIYIMLGSVRFPCKCVHSEAVAIVAPAFVVWGRDM